MPRFLADVLTWPGNRGYVTAIKAARSYSVPPTVLILTKRQPSEGWSAADKKLAIAFQILEDETCPDCGIPVWIGHSDDEAVVFEIKSRTCYACAEIEDEKVKEEKRHARRNSRKTSSGTKRFLSQEPTNKPMPPREAYYKAELEL